MPFYFSLIDFSSKTWRKKTPVWECSCFLQFSTSDFNHTLMSEASRLRLWHVSCSGQPPEDTSALQSRLLWRRLWSKEEEKKNILTSEAADNYARPRLSGDILGQRAGHLSPCTGSDLVTSSQQEQGERENKSLTPARTIEADLICSQDRTRNVQRDTHSLTHQLLSICCNCNIYTGVKILTSSKKLKK